MIVEMTSLVGDNTPAALANFDPITPYVWLFIDTALGFSGTAIEDIAFIVNDSQFAAANGIPSGHFSAIQDTPLSLALQFAPFLRGDYNGNNIIDAADYTAWRDALTAGATSLTNDPTPGTVDESDFTYGRAQFGEMLGTGAGASAAAVPEPSSAMLLILAVAGWCLRRRRAA